MNLSGKTVLVLGLGESGLAMARWCAREGAAVRVADTRGAETEGPPKVDALKAALPGAEVHLGALKSALIDGADLVAVSPGLSLLQQPQQALLAQAAQRGIPVCGEIELFAQKLAALKADSGYAPRIVAVTGTNGKTTVTSLTGKLCERAGLKTRVAGNISPAALDALADAIDRKALPDAWVIELSSFQLATTYTLAADAATVLNLTQDHLDWHGDMAEYGASKARIFAANTVRVLNRDDPKVIAMFDPRAETLTFGLGEPRHAGEFGVEDDGGLRWLVFVEMPKREGQSGAGKKKARKKSAPLSAPAAPGEEPLPGTRITRLMPTEALRIRGEHNVANALAALALCRALDLPMAPLLHALRDYRGEPHRVELLGRFGEVDYFDDSKGTNVGATVAALNGLAAELSGLSTGGRIVLIAGGEGKGQDFSPLAEPVARHVRAVFLIGKDAGAIREALEGSENGGEDARLVIEDSATLEDAVAKAVAAARPNDIVLLSPACASLDMFRDYKHRAEVFVEAVRRFAIVAEPTC